MSGLRERKKEKTRKSILECSEKLFAKNGFKNTTIDEIAGCADVGVGTVYNYFGGKTEILVAILTDRTDSVLKAGAQILGREKLGVKEGLKELLGLYLTGYFAYDREMMREAVASSILYPDGFGQKMCELDYQLKDQLERLIERFVAEGLLRPDLNLEAASGLLFGSFVNILLRALVVMEICLPEANELMAEKIEWLLNGWQEVAP